MMKRSLFAILSVVFFAAVVFAAGVPSPETPWPMVDSSGNCVSTTHPMPVDAVVTIGSVTVSAGAVPDTASNTVVSVTTVSQSITALANRNDFTVFNIGTETLWLGIGTTTGVVVSQGVPVYGSGYFSRDMDATVPVTVIASTPTTAIIHQGGF